MLRARTVPQEHTTNLRVCIHENTQGLSGVGSSTSEDCICNAGYFWDSTNIYCQWCDGGKYKDTIGNQACTDCPQFSAWSSNDVLPDTACACNVGYTGSNSGTCKACAAGKYKATKGSAACTDCPAGKYSTSLAR